MEFLGNIKNSIVNALTTAPEQSVSISDLVGMEEVERSRRINQAAQSKIDKDNAANVSTLIRSQSFPVFRGNLSKGYKRATTRSEEEERRRRLTNKSESALRRSNANKTARMVQSLGWPFYRQGYYGAQFISMDPTKLLEEEERQWRTVDNFWAPTAKHNAATVANIIRWNNFQRNPTAGFRRHTRHLEEQERSDRINGDVMNNAIQNAYNESGIIRQKGYPFYVQEAILAKRDFSHVHKLEEAERALRMQDSGQKQLAREVGGHMMDKDVDLEEEEERIRRITDVGQQKLTKENAKNVSLLVRESSSNKLAGNGPMWFNITRSSMRTLEEIERTRRLRDSQGQNVAREHAKLVSNLVIGRQIAPPKPNSQLLEEQERQSRLFDRAQQQLAMKNARKVAGLVARHALMSSGSKSYAIALEEGERSRRLQDVNEQSIARDIARKVSNLVATLEYETRDAPIAEALEPIAAPSTPITVAPTLLPSYSAPIFSSPIAVDIPSTPIFQAPITIAEAPIQSFAQTSYTQAPITSYTAPITQSPSYTTPISSFDTVDRTPAQMSPMVPIDTVPACNTTSFEPIYEVSGPIDQAPVSSLPMAVEIPSTPFYQAPITIAEAPIESFAQTSYTEAPVTSFAAPIESFNTVDSTPVQISSMVPMDSVSNTTSFASDDVSGLVDQASAPYTQAPITSYTAPTEYFTVDQTPTEISSIAPIVAAPAYNTSLAPIDEPTTFFSTPITEVPTTSYSTPIAQVPTIFYSTPITEAPTASFSTPITEVPTTSYSTPITTSYSTPITEASTASFSTPITEVPTTSYSTPITTSYSTPVTEVPTTFIAEVSEPIVQAPAPIVQAPAPIVQAPAPIVQAPAPIVQAPAPIAQAPAPAPIARKALPGNLERSSSEFHSPLVAAAPTMPRSVSATNVANTSKAAPVAAVPVASNTRSHPLSVGSTVPADVTANPAIPLGEKQRKRLLKEANKHNKRSENIIRKAEQSILKAEKLHQKGRDDKAMKLESKAEMLMQKGEHERRWASGLQSEVSHAPAPASM